MAKKKQNRLPVDFNAANPPLAVTDPDAADRASEGEPIDREYPKHLAKADGDGREVVSVQDAAEERAFRARGYMTHHELDAKQKKAAPADKASKKKPAAKGAKKKPAAKKAKKVVEPAGN